MNNKSIRVAFVGDGFPYQILQVFAAGSTRRRPRRFTLEDGLWQGEIQYGEERQYSVPVVLEQVDSYSGVDADWFIVGSKLETRKPFTFSPRRVAMALSKAEPPKGKVLLVNTSRQSKLEKVFRDAANHLSAEITSTHVFRPDFLAFPSGIESRHFRTVADWINDGQTFTIISGACLNADESRQGIVSRLNPGIVDLLARTAQAAFDQLPINEWYIYTFGPRDFDWLGELGIQKVLLPYMWDAPKDKVLDDMTQNFELIQGLGQAIQQKLDFPVKVGQLSDHAEEVDLPWLVEVSRERAAQMLPRLMAQPPAIFAQLRSQEEIISRIQQEAFLYLLDTIKWGQLNEENRQKILCVGLEVHGGYWAHGNLFDGPRGEFLPMAWLPQAVRQHWGDWATRNRTLARERERLSHMLTFFGY